MAISRSRPRAWCRTIPRCSSPSRAWSSSSRSSSPSARRPWPRATTVQPCLRTVDIDVIGTDLAATAPSSRCWGTSASGTTSRPWRSRSPGSCSPRARPRRRTPLGHGHVSDDEAEAFGATPSACCPERLQRTRRGQLLEDGRDRSLRAELGDLLRPGLGLRRRRGTGPAGRALRRDLEPGVHAVRPARRRLADPASPAEHRHRGRARPDPPHDPGRRLGVRHRPVRAHPRGGVGRHRARLRERPRRATSASASSPTTPAPSPS